MSTSLTITRAALELFYQQGFHATGVEQLSLHAGVTKKTLYRHFASKEHLVAAALELRHQDFMQLMSAFVEAYEVSQRPLAYIEFIAQWAQQAGFHGCLFINAAAEYAQASEPAHARAREHKQQLNDYLQALCRNAGLAQPQLQAQQLFVLGEGLIVSSQVQGASAELVNATRSLAQRLVQ